MSGNPVNVLFVAGEASGDLHGSAVLRALKFIEPGIATVGIGGDMMRREGMELIHHCADLSFMGFVEVLRNLGTIHAVERKLEDVLVRRKPDVAVLIDYPGFNLRFARKVKAHGIPVLYYISPQVWAWNRGRVKNVRRLVDQMKVVFPFEVEIYRKVGVDVEFVGHPLVEHLAVSCAREEFFAQNGLDPRKQLLGLFPGSRPQEIDRILPVMAMAGEALQKSRPLQLALGVAPNLGKVRIRTSLPAGANITMVENGTYDLMAHADAAIVTSGTATLEAGWFGTPMAVVYRTSPLTYLIGRMLVDMPYIGLVNIVAGRKVVPEFVQHAMTVENVTRAVGRMLDDTAFAQSLRSALDVIKTNLGAPGASERVARGIMQLARSA